MTADQPASHVYAIVENGIVENVIVASADFITAIKGAAIKSHVRIDRVNPRPGIGWRYSGQKWTAPEAVPERVAPQFEVTLDGLLPQ